MKKYTANEVAKWFLDKDREMAFFDETDGISNLKLLKLLYYAQGAHLSRYGTPLFDDEIMHWLHGPVIPEIYHKYKSFKSNPIVFEEEFVREEEFDPRTNELLENVFENMGIYSAWYLRDLTHQERPWLESTQGEVIPIELIKDYFEENYDEYFQE